MSAAAHPPCPGARVRTEGAVTTGEPCPRPLGHAPCDEHGCGCGGCAFAGTAAGQAAREARFGFPAPAERSAP